MRASSFITSCAFAVGAIAGVVAGCQVYDFEPVTPLALGQETVKDVVVAKNLKPNLMLLVDKSNSMDLPADSSLPECQLEGGGTCGGSESTLCDPAVCPTRWSELKGAMDEFLTNNGAVARMGLTLYPINAQCGAPSADGAHTQFPIIESEDVLDDLAAHAANINDRIQAITSEQNTDAGILFYTAGGTPTGDSISALSTREDLNAEDGREDYILLLTDGLPNCNANYEGDTTTCYCTSSSCTTTDPTRNRQGCLDEEGTVAKIAAARGQEIKTIVVGFGAETASGVGPQVLNAMAEAGGFARKCPNGTDAECGAGDTCDPVTRTCQVTKYYQAASRTELAAALAAIAGSIRTDPCVFPISSRPDNEDGRLVVVYLTEGGVEERLTEGADTFDYDSGVVTLVGSTCNRVQNATALNPITVEIRILTGL